MVEQGIKPCYIFDGKPPELKGGVVGTHSSSSLLRLHPLHLYIYAVDERVNDQADAIPHS